AGRDRPGKALACTAAWPAPRRVGNVPPWPPAPPEHRGRRVRKRWGHGAGFAWPRECLSTAKGREASAAPVPDPLSTHDTEPLEDMPNPAKRNEPATTLPSRVPFPTW